MPTSNSDPFLPSPNAVDISGFADLFLHQRHRDRSGRLTLRHWQGQFWKWSGTHYQPLLAETLQAELYRELARDFRTYVRPPQMTSARVSQARKALIAQITPDITLEPGTWLGKGGPRRLLAMTNGLIDLDRLLRGEAATPEPHSPEWFSPIVLPYAHALQAGASQWLAFLDEYFEGDAQRVQFLHEWLGYLLAGGVELQRFLALVGRFENGPGTVLAVITALLGRENVSHAPFGVIGQHLCPFSLIQGKLAIVTDENDRFSARAERVLSAFTSGEPVTLQRKSKRWQAMPTARIVFSTPAVPKFRDSALAERMSVLPFSERTRVAAAASDFDLAEPFRSELPGIFNLAMAAYRPIAQGVRGFTEPTAAARTRGKALRENSIVASVMRSVA